LRGKQPSIAQAGFSQDGMRSRYVLQNSMTIVHLILFHPNVFSFNLPRMACCRAWSKNILNNESLQEKYSNYNKFYAKWHLMTAIASLPHPARLTHNYGQRHFLFHSPNQQKISDCHQGNEWSLLYRGETIFP